MMQSAKRVVVGLAKKPARALLNALGYQAVRRSPIASFAGYELYRYAKPDGSFDYDKYRQVQTEGNKAKLGQVWASEENIAFLSRYLTKHLSKVEFGLCHGTRQGKEQAWFKKYLGCEVLGTEISDNARSFPDTTLWDFHDIRSEWLDSVDFIYSNSFDHSYDPEQCLRSWISCLRTGGLCIIEHSDASRHATELDPFGADSCLLPYLVLTWGKGDFYVREVLEAPNVPGGLAHNRFFVVARS